MIANEFYLLLVESLNIEWLSKARSDCENISQKLSRKHEKWEDSAIVWRNLGWGTREARESEWVLNRATLAARESRWSSRWSRCSLDSEGRMIHNKSCAWSFNEAQILNGMCRWEEADANEAQAKSVWCPSSSRVVRCDSSQLHFPVCHSTADLCLHLVVIWEQYG